VATVMTVCGPVDEQELGFTLPHEHVFINLMREFRAEGLLHEPQLMAAEVARFREAGGRTLVDCTTDEIGRDPLAIRRISEATGVNVVMGCGHYRDPYLDRDWFDRNDVDTIADAIVREIEDGVGETGIRPGVIGEIGADKWYISAAEERSFRAAARAHLRTGLTITTHAARWPVGLPQLDLLETEGVPPEKVIVGHCDTVPDPEYHLELARRGAWVQFDTIRGATEYDTDARVDYVFNLVRAGFLDRILLSHDICWRSLLHVTGGCGFAFISDVLLPRLLEAGLDEEALHRLTVANPRRALTGSH
jgi:predicted metal-dependent phosphotriesterase family hydrolase